MNRGDMDRQIAEAVRQRHEAQTRLAHLRKKLSCQYGIVNSVAASWGDLTPTDEGVLKHATCNTVYVLPKQQEIADLLREGQETSRTGHQRLVAFRPGRLAASLQHRATASPVSKPGTSAE